MKLNENTKIVTEKVILVPYLPCHVLKYHDWMKNPELQALTASEPLSLSQEYEMQQSWRDDEDKCTFIILDKDLMKSTKNEIEAMVGDTNLFLQEEEGALTAEAEIMIAEASARGKGLGKQALVCMLLYGAHAVGVKIYEAKIGLENTLSQKLFSKLGFTQESVSKVFNEVTMRKDVTDEWLQQLKAHLKEHVQTAYVEES